MLAYTGLRLIWLCIRWISLDWFCFVLFLVERKSVFKVQTVRVPQKHEQGGDDYVLIGLPIVDVQQLRRIIDLFDLLFHWIGLDWFDLQRFQVA